MSDFILLCILFNKAQSKLDAFSMQLFLEEIVRWRSIPSNKSNLPQETTFPSSSKPQKDESPLANAMNQVHAITNEETPEATRSALTKTIYSSLERESKALPVKQEREDLCQETFLKLLPLSFDFSCDEQARAYLRRALKHNMISSIYRKTYHKRICLRTREDQPEQKDFSQSPDRLVLVDDLRRELEWLWCKLCEACLKTLTRKDARQGFLRGIEEMNAIFSGKDTISEICIRSSRKAGSVYQSHRRIRRLLKKQLDQIAEWWPGTPPSQEAQSFIVRLIGEWKRR